MSEMVNSNISFFIAFISSLWGFSYPMLLQVISTIDSKYQSTHILALLKESYSYMAYKYSLIANYVLLLFYFITANYNIFYCSDCYLDLTIIIVLFVTLSVSICTLLWFFKDINTFLSARSLEERFASLVESQKNNLSKDVLLAWADYVIFVINSGYIGRSSDIFSFYEKYVCYLRKSNREYPKELHDVTIVINRAICSSQDDFSFTCFDASRLLRNFYGYDEKFNPEDLFKTLWLCLLQQIYYNKDKAIFKYWEAANQRNGLYFADFKHNEIDKKEYSLIEKEFHLMLCVNLFYDKKVDLLKDILFYSNATPPKYNLIPSRFSDIFEWLLDLNTSQYLDKYKFETKYIVLGIKDVFSDELRNNAIRFLALLCCRLKYLVKFLFFDNVFQHPKIKVKTPIEIKKYEDSLSLLKDELEEIKKLNLEKEYFGSRVVINDELEKTINEFAREIVDKKTQIEKNQSLSGEMIKEGGDIIKNIIERNIDGFSRFVTLEQKDLPLVDHFDDDRFLFEKQIVIIERKQDTILEAKHFKEGQLVPIINLAESLADGFCSSINYKISLELQTRVCPLEINFNLLVSHLDRITLDENKYFILASIDNEWRFKETFKFKETDGKCFLGKYELVFVKGYFLFNHIVFVDKDAMPKIYIKEPKSETKNIFDLKKIGNNYPLYLGVVSLNQESELLKRLKAKENKDYSTNVYLSIFCSIYLYVPNNWAKLSFKIDDFILDEDINLDSINDMLSLDN